MSTSLQHKLRCCMLGVLAILVMQLAFVLVLSGYGLHSYGFVTRKLLLSQEYESWCHRLEWREFIAHTPHKRNEFYQYNRQLSDKLAAVRSLPVTRHESCNTRTYTLPHASGAKLSIVLSFYNESRSMLLRTVLSLISRTPEDYLHELILIDDCSDDGKLLSSFVKHLNLVRLFVVSLLESLKRLMAGIYALRGSLTLIFKRNLRRKGLIWSRNEGARVASGHYLLFLDSHCEVNDGWLEPLLDRLALNTSLAVSPLLDPIDPKTLSYQSGNVLLKGGFDWSLHFHWLPRVLAPAERPESAFSSPTFAGGILMISRERFFQLQGFNPHLQIWGGESIEFAIKLWLCGGQIEIVPCSRIGHIFRQRHAFRFPPQFEAQQLELELELELDTAQATYLRNSKIIAESWLDEYKYLFYALKPAAKQIPLTTNVLLDSHRLALTKAGQHCQRFDWYIRHVSTELQIQHGNFSALGTLRNDQRCLHVDITQPQLQLLLISCFSLDITQWHLQQETGQLRTETMLCLGSKSSQLTVEPCLRTQLLPRHSQQWLRRDTQLLHAQTHLCLDNPLGDQLALSSCRPHATSQAFQFALEMEAQNLS